MKKIQYDAVNGVELVESFEKGVDIVTGFEISDLKEEFGGVRGAEVTEEQLAEIEEEYGIN